jgi:protein TonB
LKRHGILPGDGFVWRFALVLFVHGGVLVLIVSSMKKPLSLVLEGDLGGGAIASPVPMQQVNWVDVSVTDVVASLARAPGPKAEEPESDLPLPGIADASMPPPEPAPVPKVEPPKETALKPAPKPEPPKETAQKPAPKPEPPKETALKPAPKPEPLKETALKPAPAPKSEELPIAPRPVVAATKVPDPVPAPIRAVPVPVAVPPAAAPGAASSGRAVGSPGFGAGPGGAGGPLSPISAFHLGVKEVYFSQWQQPHGLVESGAKYRVRVEIVIARDGEVVSARVVAKSGNAEMDRSVQEAVGRVARVDPLPEGIGGASYAILLNFDI